MARPKGPVKLSKKPVVVVLKEEDIERMRYEGGSDAELLVNEDVQVVTYPVVQPKGFMRDLDDRGLLRPGTVLVQSPYERDHYAPLVEAEQSFAIAKRMYFSELCMKLGAKEVKVDQIAIRTRKGTSTFDVDASKGGIKFEGKRERESLEKISSEMTLKDRFEGGQADIKAAEEMLRRTKLLGDPNMYSLFEMAKAENNKLQERTLTIDLTRESQDVIRLAASLAIPAYVDINTKYKKNVNETEQYTLTLTVKF